MLALLQRNADKDNAAQRGAAEEATPQRKVGRENAKVPMKVHKTA